MKNTGVTTHAQAQAGKIRVGGNSSPVKFNGMSVKRKPSKLFNKVVNAPDREFNKLVTDHVNINKTAKSIMEAAMTRNTTKAAATINIPANRQPNQEKTAVTKFTDDEETLGGAWSSHMKKEAAGRMKSDTEAGKSVEIPVMRMASFDTRNSLPPEFRNPKEIPNVVGMTLTDLPKPNTVKGGAAASRNPANKDKSREGQWPSEQGLGDLRYPEETASSHSPNSRW